MGNFEKKNGDKHVCLPLNTVAFMPSLPPRINNHAPPIIYTSDKWFVMMTCVPRESSLVKELFHTNQHHNFILKTGIQMEGHD